MPIDPAKVADHPAAATPVALSVPALPETVHVPPASAPLILAVPRPPVVISTSKEPLDLSDPIDAAEMLFPTAPDWFQPSTESSVSAPGVVRIRSTTWPSVRLLF